MNERIKNAAVLEKVVTAEEAAALITDGMVVGASGFTGIGYPKAVPMALARRVEAGDNVKITLLNGGSVGDQMDGELARAGVVARRYGFQNNKSMRDAINKGDVTYVDTHVSQLPKWIKNGIFGKIDVAIIEVSEIDENGNLIPSCAVGISDILAKTAEKIIVEVNETLPTCLKGFHDVYTPEKGTPIPLTEITQRIGTPYIECPPEKLAAVVITNDRDTNRNLPDPDENMQKIAGHIISFLEKEMESGRMSNPLPPLQSGVGGVANAILNGLTKSNFKNMTVFTEVMQDAVMDLMDCGKVDYATGTALTISPEKLEEFYEKLPKYAGKIVIRPQEISNSPELINRFGVIAMNTAIEFDLAGNVNSTHINGTKIMNGIGGSADYTRNCGLSIFTTASTAKNGTVSCVVPHVTHVDHTEHDTQIIVTEQGLADLRGLNAYERAEAIIENCAHPDFRDELRAFVAHSRADAEGMNALILK